MTTFFGDPGHSSPEAFLREEVEVSELCCRNAATASFFCWSEKNLGGNVESKELYSSRSLDTLENPESSKLETFAL